MMNHSGYAMGSGGAFLALVVVLLIGVAVISAVVAARSRGQGRTTTTPDAGRADAERILADRLARGDIGSDEYEQRLRALRNAQYEL